MAQLVEMYDKETFMKKLFVFVAMLTIFASNAFAEPRLLKWEKIENPNCLGYIIEMSGDLGVTWAEVGRTDSAEIITMEVDAPVDKLYLYRASAVYQNGGVVPQYVSGTWFDATKNQGPPSGLNVR